MTSGGFGSTRIDYRGDPLDRHHLDQDPREQFSRWLEIAISEGVLEPTAFILSTVSRDGAPSSRTVLLKDLSPEGLVFYTNFRSRKAEEIAHDPRVSAVFLWLPLHRQVRIEGIVDQVDDATSDRYFQSRPLEAQLASAASPQSQVVPDRAYLEGLLAEISARYPDGNVPRPDHWGGYRLRPNYYEFWQGREARFHDRFRYLQTESGWQIDRLAP